MKITRKLTVSNTLFMAIISLYILNLTLKHSSSEEDKKKNQDNKRLPEK